MKKIIKIIAVMQMLAGGFGLGWAVFSIFINQSIQGLIMLWAVLHLFAVIGGILLLKGDSFGVILSAIFQLPQVVFWKTTNSTYYFLSGAGIFINYGPNGKWGIKFDLYSRMNYISGFGNDPISPEMGINLVPLAITTLMIIYAVKVCVKFSPGQIPDDFSDR